MSFPSTRRDSVRADSSRPDSLSRYSQDTGVGRKWSWLSEQLSDPRTFWEGWWPGLGSILLMLVLWQVGVAGAIELAYHKLLFRFQTPQTWDERIVLVKIDQPSLDDLGWFPWSRDRYRQLVERVLAAGPNTVVLDLIFSEETPEDDGLAIAMAEHGHVLLATAWHLDKEPWLPTPELDEAAIATGHIATLKTSSLVTVNPRTAVYAEVKGQPTLALSIARVQQLQDPEILLPQDYSLLIPNWPAPVEQLEQYSFSEVVTGRIAPEIFRDKIILVGVTAPGIDPLITPFEQLGPVSGVHLHAALLHSLLQQNTLHFLPATLWPPLLLMWLLICRYGLTRFPLRQRGRLLLLGAMAWLLLGALALRFNRLLPIAMPLSLMGGAGLMGLVSQNRKLSQTNQKLQYQALVDETTEIKNRSFFNEYSSLVWQQMVRDDRPLSLILCDVDHFKAYNDTYGHPAGDRCLHQIAQAIQTSVHRASELVARYGGEEFVVLLPATNLDGAVCVAQHIQTEVLQRDIPHGGSLTSERVTLSLGIACMQPSSDQTLEQLIEQADRALYRAKARGRNRYCSA